MDPGIFEYFSEAYSIHPRTQPQGILSAFPVPNRKFQTPKMFAVMLVKIASGWVRTRPCSIGASLIHFPLSRFDLFQDNADFLLFL